MACYTVFVSCSTNTDQFPAPAPTTPGQQTIVDGIPAHSGLRRAIEQRKTSDRQIDARVSTKRFSHR
ncbi:hypothetical protein VTJ04DRAFT_4336 [Mycothermus thermophilus]|uniref:uncharacterized protein n=1 Tax=Humicola insolens TaxID=85995 RepID=UPI00374402F0